MTRWRRAGVRAQALRQRAGRSRLEVVAGVVSAAWAAWVWGMHGDLGDRAAWAAVARWAPDELWAALGLAGGGLQVAAALAGHRAARWVLAVALAGYWLLLADGLRLGAPGTPGIVAYLGWAAAEGVTVVRLGPWGRLLAARPGWRA